MVSSFKLPFSQTLLCYLLAFIAGAEIMMIEMGGARLLTPFFGVSLYVWTSQIAVGLLALSLGYWLGGRQADQNPALTAVRWILTFAALYLLFLPWVAPQVLRYFGGWGLRKGALSSALVLFGLPLTLLGTLSPYLLRILSGSLRTLGKSVGGLYALSTLGSMIGTLVVGYYLLPALGTHKMIYFMSLGLFLSVVLLLILEKNFLQCALFLALCLVLLEILFRSPILINKTIVTRQGPVKLQELYQKDSFYGKIKVVETNQRYRFLLVNGIPQAEMDMFYGKNALEYIDHMRLLGQTYAPGAQRVLFLGLGGGGLEREFRRRGLKTVTVEIDPQIVTIARNYFNWDGTPDSLFIEDARFFLEKNPGSFDLIFVDCFSGESLPFHLLSEQSLGRMKERLSSSGVLIINFPSVSRLSSPLAPASLMETLRITFPQVKVYAGSTYLHPESICNYIFVASAKPLEGLTFMEQTPSAELAALLSRQVNFSHPQARIIQDDFNPMDVYEQEAREFFRRQVLKNIDWDFLIY